MNWEILIVEMAIGIPLGILIADVIWAKVRRK